MKKFTIKDFILYNSPCFNCKNLISFKLRFIQENENCNNLIGYIKPIINSNIEIDLYIKYNDSLKLFICPKTNIITTNNLDLLKKYLSNHKLSLFSICDTCHTHIESKFLDFNLDKSFILPVSLYKERIMLYDKKSIYEIYSDFINNTSRLSVIDVLSSGAPSLIINLPLLPLYKFKNKEALLLKLKTYIMLS